MRVSKEVIKHIEQEIRLFHQSKKELTKLRDGSAGETSSPALYMIKRIQSLEDIVEAIDTVYNKLPPHKQNLIELLYWSEPRLLTFDGIAQKCYVSRRQAFKYRDDIVREIALNLGWIK